VLRRAGDLVTIDDAAGALGIAPIAAAKLLARWAAQGWLTRLRRGLYAPMPLAAEEGDRVIEDAWRLVPELFAPGYVGGVTAAQHWDLTEQLFRSVFVFTERNLHRREENIQGVPFELRHISAERMFGTTPVWRGPVKVAVSDVHRTIVDMLDDPSCGGGIRHVAGCLRSYLDRKDASSETLVDYAQQLGNGAVFKRLGFLAERHGHHGQLARACIERMSKGVAKLDPALASPRLIRRWRLWVPSSWKVSDSD
jgi:predicted transcriptional regulator of viral defense system